ncbi:MAG TPA: O-antigen ligase family protein [Solirubrobacteraceae bacterium]|jgi:tetratricopeptide (TPR) repeat protein|nr:O-antigen ligase family protein [Solirubrobacteraceae bacterium]
MPTWLGSTAKFSDGLRAAPATIPCVGAIALFVVWASDQAGYPITHWAPGGLIVLGLLGVALIGARARLRELPRAVLLALACLVLYTALSYLSILWANVQGVAWEGANRTLLYLLVFALFALWPQRGSTAALLLGGWALAMTGLAVFVVLHVDAASHLARLFSEGRLQYPGDYENASAATWAMAAWPALLLASSERLHWALRGLLAGGAVVLADLSLLSLSRGSLFSTPVLLVLIFVLLPRRLRTFAVLVPVAIGVGATAPSILRVGDRLLHGGDAPAAMHAATAAIFIAALVVGVVVGFAAAAESRATLSDVTAQRLRRGGTAIAVVTLVAVLAGAWIVAGNPVERVEHGWNTFKGGYAADRATGSRLTSGFGSDRYDFYRVALNEFVDHPIVGIGADNFQQGYLLHGRGTETPRFPHSVELRTLTQTGIVGAPLAVVGLLAALLAAGRAALSRSVRRADPLAASVAAAALAGFAYWVVHGSFDWFWEFAGLGAPAFALLGIGCALAPRRRAEQGAGAGVSASDTPAGTQRGRVVRRLGGGRVALLATFAVLALAAAASLIAPWLSQLQLERAARIWPTAPRQAYSELDEAASLNPLSEEPELLAGGIALRFGDLARADSEFAKALQRNPRDTYATLERGAIASARGERKRALALLRRTARLSPRDELIHEVLAVVEKGERISIDRLNRSILLKARQFS